MHKCGMLQRPAAALALTPELLAGRARRAWLLFTAVALAIIAAALYGAGLYGRSTEIEALATQGRTDANLKVALLRAVLENPRALPLLLSEDQQVHDALSERSPAAIDVLNRKLEGLVSGTKASVLYVTGTDGLAIASSNWREPESFVGSDYSFRAYFSGAMQTGTAEYFALGNVSKRPGLYISRRVDGGSGPLGVVVVKMEFDQLEADWHEASRPAYVSDAHGVVLITSVPSWRFLTTEPLSRPMLAEIRASQQFGDAPLVPLPITRPEALSGDVALVHALTPGSIDAEYLRLSTAISFQPKHRSRRHSARCGSWRWASLCLSSPLPPICCGAGNPARCGLPRNRRRAPSWSAGSSSARRISVWRATGCRPRSPIIAAPRPSCR